MLSGPVVFSTSEDGYGAAVGELYDAFGRDLAISRFGPDTGRIDSAAIGVRDVREACFARPIAFVRHLTAEQVLIPPDVAADLEVVAQQAVEAIQAIQDQAPGGIAVQAWVSGSPKMPYSAGALAGAVTSRLTELGWTVARSKQPLVLSLCITTRGVLAGLNRSEDSLSDWPGGRVRLGRTEGLVSRAEFKLEELFDLYPFDLPGGTAIDLGAAPGGWTRILRQRGFEVWAIDPGDMAPSLMDDPGVHHERTTAGEFFRSSRQLFDLAVNDMRMDAERSCSVMTDAASRLKPGAYVVVTLKTGTYRPVATMRRCLTLLRREYEIRFARQLHHNRHELTVVAQRRM